MNEATLRKRLFSSPVNWQMVKIGQLVQRVRRPVKVEPNEVYQEIGIRSHGKGIFYKEPRKGVSLGNKSVFWIEPDCFIVNIVFAWEQAIAKTTASQIGMIASHRFPMYKPKAGKLNLDYLVYFFKTPRGKHLLELASPGGAGRNKTLGQEAFLALPIPLPPYDEQQKIAAILTTWDDALALLDRRIAAAGARKRGLMQRLLTGQVRFPEFTDEERVTYKIRTLLKVVKRPVEWNDNTDYHLISVKRRSGGLFLRQVVPGHEIKTKKMNTAYSGDFLISKMQVVHGAWGLTTPEFDGMHISDSYVSLIPCDASKLSIEYFDWLSRMPFMYHLAYVSSHGVHIEKMTFKLQDFLSRQVTIPGSVMEQRKIVAVLNTCDRELDLLRQKRAAVAQQKQGLMQRLLTGRVRVPPLRGGNKGGE